MPGIKQGFRGYSTRGIINTSYKIESYKNPSTSSIPAPDAETNSGVQPSSEASTFNLRLQDFPPLPDTNTHHPKRNQPDKKKPEVDPKVNKENHVESSSRITFSNGKTMNLPDSIVTDQHSVTALLAFMRASETDPNLISLALREDINPNSSENKHPCHPQINNIELSQDNFKIDMVTPVNLDWYTDDFIFYIFYHNIDLLRMKAANELYEREWRYHLDYACSWYEVPAKYVQV